MTLPATVFALVALLCAGMGRPLPASAQESGTTEVTVTFDQDLFRVDMLVNPDSILTKLDRRSGHRRLAPAERVNAIEAISARRDEFLRHIVMQFDDRLARPRLDSITQVLPETSAQETIASPQIAIRLSGQVPAGAHRFSWSYGLTYAAYRLTVRQHDVVTRMLVEGEQPTAPLDLRQPQSGVRQAGVWGGVALGVFVVLFTTRRAEHRKKKASIRPTATASPAQTR